MPRDLLYSEPPPPGLVRGKIANTPASAAAPLWVTIPTYPDPTARWGPVAWSPKGAAFPQAGADCLIGFDDAGVPWLIGSVGVGAALVVTSLPSGPFDGQTIDYLADATNGIVWRLRYRAASASAYKWEFVGGASLRAEVITGQTTTSGTYTDLGTVGPSITLPLAGDFDVQIGMRATNDTANAQSYMSFAIGGTAASDNNRAGAQQGTGVSGFSAMRPSRLAGVGAVALVAKYRTAGSGTSTFEHRWMSAMPVRVG